MKFQQPKTLRDALSLLASDHWSILSGGTDFFPALGDSQPTGNILDISTINTLDVIQQDADYWRIGALVTWSDVIKADLPPAFDGLKLAAREVGSIQIQNRATVAGNICNASPAADGMPPLLTLDTIVRLSSASGIRDVALDQFVTGNRSTLARPDELLTELLIPKTAAQGHSHFIKLGARKYLVISISMVAARITLDSQRYIKDVAISVGSCSAVAKRLSSLEEDLTGQKLSSELAAIPLTDHLGYLSPIDDVRATRDYRLQASEELVRRSLSNLAIQG